jgi:hypothetical protein
MESVNGYGIEEGGALVEKYITPTILSLLIFNDDPELGGDINFQVSAKCPELIEVLVGRVRRI